jgi:hypothetical protein
MSRLRNFANTILWKIRYALLFALQYEQEKARKYLAENKP